MISQRWYHSSRSLSERKERRRRRMTKEERTGEACNTLISILDDSDVSFQFTFLISDRVSTFAVQCVRMMWWRRQRWSIIHTNREEPPMPWCLCRQCVSELRLLEPMRIKQGRENPYGKVQSCFVHGTIVYWTWLIASRSSKRNQSININDIVIRWMIRKNIERNLDHGE